MSEHHSSEEYPVEEEYPTEDPPQTINNNNNNNSRSPTAQPTTVPVVPRYAPLQAPLQWGVEEEDHMVPSGGASSSGLRVRMQGGTITPTRSPRSGRLADVAHWDEPGIRTPSHAGTPRVHTRTGSSVSANNVIELEPDPEMVSYLAQQTEQSARMDLELSQQDVLCLEDEEDTGRIMVTSDEAGRRRKLLKQHRKGLAVLDGKESWTTSVSARSSLPPTPPHESLPAPPEKPEKTQDNARDVMPATTTAGRDEESEPVQREATVEPHAVRRTWLDQGTSYGATDTRDATEGSEAAYRGTASLTRPHSGTRASALPTSVDREGSALDLHDANGRYPFVANASPSPPPPAFVATAENYREALHRELARTSRFFWPLNVAPVYVPHGVAGRCGTCDARALHGDEDEEDWLYPYVDTHYYCYSLDAEMAALREARIEDAVATRVPLPATTGSVEGESEELRASKGDENDTVYASPMQRGDAVPETTGRHANISEKTRKWRYHRHYQMARMQRLWSTTVMRQYLLFSLSAFFLLALFLQNTMQGCMNIFEASIGGGWGSASGVFYSSTNRFGRTVLLTATFFCSSALTMWFIAAKQLCCGTPSTVEDAEGDLVAAQRQEEKRQRIGSYEDIFSDAAGDPVWGDANGDLATPTTAGHDHDDVPSGVHPAAMLLMGVIACTAGSVSIYGGARNTSMALAVFGEAIYGVGSVLALVGLLILTMAEVGLQAALSVQLNVIGMSWLVTNSAAFVIFPVLNRYWLTTSAVLQCSVVSTCCAVLFAVCIILLIPRDVVDRARRPYQRLATPRAVMRALADVSLGFFLRLLTFSCVTALVVLLLSSATALLDTLPTGAGKAGDANADASPAPFAAFFPGPELEPDDVRRWMSFMSLVAVILWVLMMIPRISATCARPWFVGIIVLAMGFFWCGYSILTPPLPSDQWGREKVVEDRDRDSSSSAASVAQHKAGRATDAPTTDAPRHDARRPPTLVRVVERWLLQQCFHPRICLFLTGASFAVLGTSLIRSIANAGVTLPAVPLCYHEGGRRCRAHHRRHSHHQHAASSSAVSESTGLLSGVDERSPAEAMSPEPIPLEVALEGLTQNGAAIHYQRCGGPTAMLVLSSLVALISASITAAVLGLVTWGLFYRAAHPIDPSRMGSTSIPVDAHNIVHKSVFTLVCATLGCQAVDLLYGYVRARRMRRAHKALHKSQVTP